MDKTWDEIEIFYFQVFTARRVRWHVLSNVPAATAIECSVTVNVSQGYSDLYAINPAQAWRGGQTVSSIVNAKKTTPLDVTQR